MFIVTCPVFRGCHSYGSTIDEAIANITEAIGSCLEETIVDNYTQFANDTGLEITVSPFPHFHGEWNYTITPVKM